MPKIWRKRTRPPELDTTTLLALASVCILSVGLSIMLFMSLPGCNEQDMETTVYKTLKVSAISYDAAMKSAVDLYTDEHITPEQMDAVVDAATKYRVTYLSCVSLLEAYHNIRDPTGADRDRIKKTLTACTQTLADLIAIVTEYQNKHPPYGA